MRKCIRLPPIPPSVSKLLRIDLRASPSVLKKSVAKGWYLPSGQLYRTIKSLLSSLTAVLSTQSALKNFGSQKNDEVVKREKKTASAILSHGFVIYLLLYIASLKLSLTNTAPRTPQMIPLTRQAGIVLMVALVS